MPEVQITDVTAVFLTSSVSQLFQEALAGYAIADLRHTKGHGSFKSYLNPPEQILYSFAKARSSVSWRRPPRPAKPLALLGIKACDLAALALYDRVFLGADHPFIPYRELREECLIVALTCASPKPNCFCPSTGTGPEPVAGFDLLLTELTSGLLLESGSRLGATILDRLPFQTPTAAHFDEKAAIINACQSAIGKKVYLADLPQIIYRNLEHPRWGEVAKRCVACGNCTTVCPTCFCTTSCDTLSLAGICSGEGDRLMVWDSCFNPQFARVHGGNFRASRRARFRHWMAHKLAYWIEQYGALGCVGCGRCMTWCPTGIDITVELEGLRGER